MSLKNKTAFASAIRIGNASGVDMHNSNSKGCHLIIDMTKITSEGTVTLDSGESDKAAATVQLATALAIASAAATIQMNTPLAHVFATATAQCVNVVGADYADGTVTCATAVEGNTVIANGQIFTAVNGAKADNTEFSVDVGNNETAIDLADSITNDERAGDIDDVTAVAVLAVVTITSTVRGTGGNSIPLSSSDGATLAVSAANLTGGVAGHTVVIDDNTFTGVVGAKDDNTQFSVDTGDNETALDLEDSINSRGAGTVGTVTGSASTNTVTLTTDAAGAGGNATTLTQTGGTIALSGAVFTGGITADIITINLLPYTAVAGSKGGDNTKFSVDTSNNAMATDLADSINNDVRAGGVDDLTATANTDTVTATQTVGGAGGNATTLTSTAGARVVLSGATFTGGIDADRIESNGLTYTAVAGAKADNTEFSIDGNDITDAADLADSITNDSREGVLNDCVAASGGTDTVTITTSIGGTVGNATTLSSTDEAGRLIISGSTFTGGTDNALVSSITVDGVEIMSGTEIFDTDLETTATNIAANITANTSVPNYNAVAVGDEIQIESESGGDGLAVVSTATVIGTTDVNANANDITFTLQGKDTLSGKYYTLIESAAINSVTTTILRLYPGLTASGNLIVSDVLPEIYRVIATHNDNSPVTYSVAVNLLN